MTIAEFRPGPSSGARLTRPKPPRRPPHSQLDWCARRRVLPVKEDEIEGLSLALPIELDRPDFEGDIAAISGNQLSCAVKSAAPDWFERFRFALGLHVQRIIQELHSASRLSGGARDQLIELNDAISRRKRSLQLSRSGEGRQLDSR